MQASMRRQHNDGQYGFPVTDSAFAEQLWRIDWKRYGHPYCGVYVVTTDSLYPCKIGISTTPVKRLIALQTSHWRPLQISGYRWCENAADAKRVEKEAHRMLTEADKALLGEWFDVRVPTAVEAIEWAGVKLGVKVNKHFPDDPDIRSALLETSIELSRAGVYQGSY